MLEAIKSVLKQAAHAHLSGDSVEAERLYKEAAAEAKAKDDATRAEALMGTAQMRRDVDDRIGAAIHYAEAITLLRTSSDARMLAAALRHAAEVRSELHEYAVAGSHIEEAVRLYRVFAPPAPLDLANALRVSALNNERQALASWREAEALYGAEQVTAGVEEARRHLQVYHATEQAARRMRGEG